MGPCAGGGGSIAGRVYNGTRAAQPDSGRTRRSRRSSRYAPACSTSATPKRARPTGRRSSSCTAGPTTSTATSTSRRCWRRSGFRVIVPYLRGFGTHPFLSDATVRNGQQAAVALDVIALMDALNIPTAVIGGFDWGARTADVVAALWPERCKALVVGERLHHRQPDGQPATAAAAGRVRLVVPVLLRHRTRRARATGRTPTTSTS